jgi:hypothetical protein
VPAFQRTTTTVESLDEQLGVPVAMFGRVAAPIVVVNVPAADDHMFLCQTTPAGGMIAQLPIATTPPWPNAAKLGTEPRRYASSAGRA